MSRMRVKVCFLSRVKQLSEFLRRGLMIFIIKGFRTIVFIFIVISTGVACSDPVSHNWVQVLSIPVLLLACSHD